MIRLRQESPCGIGNTRVPEARLLCGLAYLEVRRGQGHSTASHAPGRTGQDNVEEMGSSFFFPIRRSSAGSTVCVISFLGRQRTVYTLSQAARALSQRRRRSAHPAHPATRLPAVAAGHTFNETAELFPPAQHVRSVWDDPAGT